ncbi:unnamed protein product [Adineta ricciae]|uniref:Uncharacterized protein n=1 Tax=Adineta ricciae TaxID=249248 RepID=A0A815YLT6_ADIRI|nr:unnamed protein product [Adineta ricciae]CAF1572216.1 unnamed protein product [Adineta ricciae]
MYVDTFYSSLTSIVSEIAANSTDFTSILRLNLCEQWCDIFISENQILHYSLSERRQIISKSLVNHWTHLILVAGSTSTTYRNPREIFLGETNSTLFVEGCGNNRIQSCQLGSLLGRILPPIKHLI